jgi:hypothetical protein
MRPGMMTCKSCGQQISQKAEICPHCGPVKPAQTPKHGSAREEFIKALSTDPKCREAPRSGQGFVIGSAKDLSTPLTKPETRKRS